MPEVKIDKYERAKQRVADIKGFYSHLAVYLVINALVLMAHTDIVEFFVEKNGRKDFGEWLGWNMVITPVLWGIGLAFHAWHVFGSKITFFKKWEERKIREFMDEEEKYLK